jgi:cytosine/adenosine deaminase-related metal-dependent hydrolase
MLLISADWVLPVSAPAIERGAVLVDGDRIVAVGPLAALDASCAIDTLRADFPGCVITPGLVNAHTHLTLTALGGVVPPLRFDRWLPRLVAAMKPWGIADHEASGVIGAEESLASGVTVVGDIAYGAAEVASASRAGLGGVYYWELLGIEPDAIAEQLSYLRYPTDVDTFGPRVTCGLSPHSPYTSGPGLLRGVHATAAEFAVPLAIHVAESAAETELMRDGTGALAATAGRTAFGFEPPRTSTVAYLDRLGVLEGATAVHCCRLEPGDIELLAARGASVVTCPRSNRYLDNPPALLGPLLDAGIALGVGTDSSASNEDLDLLAEVRAIRAAEPAIGAAALLHIATAGGAEAIGVDDRFGSLSPGMQADLAVFAVGATRSPAEAVVLHGGRDTVRAVMSAGQWRVRDGELLLRDEAAATRAADATVRAREALALLGRQ